MTRLDDWLAGGCTVVDLWPVFICGEHIIAGVAVSVFLVSVTKSIVEWRHHAFLVTFPHQSSRLITSPHTWRCLPLLRADDFTFQTNIAGTVCAVKMSVAILLIVTAFLARSNQLNRVQTLRLSLELPPAPAYTCGSCSSTNENRQRLLSTH